MVLPDDSIGIRSVAMLSLTLDHSVMDGVHGSNFLISLKEIINNPETYFKA